MISIYIPGKPPTCTQQQHRVYVHNGRTIFALSKRLQAVKKYYEQALEKYKTDSPINEPIYVKIIFAFPYRKAEKKSLIKQNTILCKDTSPDCDNMSKLLLDCLTQSGIYEDDRLISRLTIEKCWVPAEMAGIYIKITELDNNLFENSIVKMLSDYC